MGFEPAATPEAGHHPSVLHIEEAQNSASEGDRIGRPACSTVLSFVEHAGMQRVGGIRDEKISMPRVQIIACGIKAHRGESRRGHIMPG